MALYHFSEDPTIPVFVPRPPIGRPDKEPRVWAIDEWHSPLYFLPSECPRATYWPVADTTAADRSLHWPDERVRMVIAIEHAWLERFLNTRLYRYAMPEEVFVPSGGDYGAYVSEETVVPLGVEEVGPLWRAMREYSVDFRVLPSLRAFAHQMMETTFHWSLIRMRNSADWDIPLVSEGVEG